MTFSNLGKPKYDVNELRCTHKTQFHLGRPGFGHRTAELTLQSQDVPGASFVSAFISRWLWNESNFGRAYVTRVKQPVARRRPCHY